MNLKQATRRASQSTVRVSAEYVPEPRKLNEKVLGTGVIVNRQGFVVTALHVVEAATQILHGRLDGHLNVAFPGSHDETEGMMIFGSFVAQKAVVVDTDEKNDLALLQIRSRNTQSLSHFVGPSKVPAVAEPMVLALERPDVGELVASSGYPLGESTLVTTSGPIANALAVDPDTRADRYLVDMTANPGNSGGPIYRVTDCVLVGVLVAGKMVRGPDKSYAAGLTIVVPAKAVAELLQRTTTEFGTA